VVLHVFNNYWFFYLTNIKNCRITNKNRKDFVLASIFTNLKGRRLQLENLDKLIFDSKNWPNDARIGCKSPSDLVEFVDMDERLEEKL